MKDITMRICKKCGESFPLTDEYFFYREKCKDGFSPKCLRCMGGKFGKRRINNNWSEKDINILKLNYENMSNKELIEKYFPNRTISQITDVARRKLNIHKSKNSMIRLFWSEKDEDFLKENYYKMTSTELSLLINKTVGAIKARGLKLGLRKDNCKKLMPLDNIKKILEVNGLEFINMLEDYNNRHSLFEIKCKEKGHISQVSYNSLYAIDFTCKYCNKDTPVHNKISFQELEKMFIEKEYLPLFNEKSYKNCKSDLDFICKKHDVLGVQTTNYLSIKNKDCSCKYCQLENKMGETSSNWKGGISKANELFRNCIYEWKKQSMMECNYKCVLTGSKMDIIHHLYNFNKITDEAHLMSNIIKKSEILEYTEQELIILKDNIINLHKKYGNGVCLNEDIHKLFHKLYGSIENNENQFNEFKQRYKLGEFNDIFKKVC